VAELVTGLGIFLFILGGAMIGIGYYLGKKIPPLHVMLYFMAMFTFLIGTLMLAYPDSFESIFN
jgi:hypothetical protein